MHVLWREKSQLMVKTGSTTVKRLQLRHIVYYKLQKFGATAACDLLTVTLSSNDKIKAFSLLNKPQQEGITTKPG